MRMRHFLDPHICRRLLVHAARHATSTAAARYDRPEVAGMANFKMYLLRQFCLNWVEFFTIHRRHRRKKMMDQNFEIQILWFLRFFFKFSKRCRAVHLRPNWTIMVAAKLDQSRVLVTKFHQNRSTLKGRSAGQRHTHRQTNSAENKGPLGFAIGPTGTSLFQKCSGKHTIQTSE